MKSFFKKNLGKLILVLVFAIAGAVITGISLKPKVFYEVDKTVQTVEFDGNNAYLTFYNDDITYIAYESNGVDFTLLSQLNSGDSVNIKLREQSGKSTYTIIYILKRGDQVFFDVMEYYRKNDLVVSTIFITIPFSASLLVLMFTIIQFKKPENNPKEFAIYYPRAAQILFILSFSLGLIVSIEFLIFCLLNLIPPHNYPFCFISLIFLAIGLLGLIVYKRGCFSFKNGVYKYVDVFKTKEAKLSEIAVVYVKTNPTMRIYVANHGGEIICILPVEGIIFRQNLFLESLKDNNIKIEPTYIASSKEEKNQIKALRLFDEKEYDQAYPLFENLCKISNADYYKYYLMICAVYYGDLDKAMQLHKDLVQNKDYTGKDSCIYSYKQIEYYFALSLAENHQFDEAKLHLDRLMELVPLGGFSDDKEITKDMMKELIDKTISEETDKNAYYIKI